jgi:hypothetical protein
MGERNTKFMKKNNVRTEQDEPGYAVEQGRKIRIENWYVTLLIAAGLPLLDGFFLSFLATGLWEQVAQSVAFGLNAFSGAACVVTAMKLSGSLHRRLSTVAFIYLLLGIAAVLIAVARPFFESLLPPNLNLFTAIFLIGLALQVSGEARLQRYAGYLGWMAAVKVMIVASVLQGMIYGFNWSFVPDLLPLPSVVLSVLAGFGLTTVGVLLGYFVGHAGDDVLRPLRLSATVSLLGLGLNVLGLGIAPGVILAPLLAGIAWTLVSVLRSTVAATQRVKQI